MKSNYQAALDAVLKAEGGFVNDPRDSGGPTMKGVTQRVYDAYRAGRGLGIRDVQGILDSELQAIFRKQFWDAIRGDDLPAGVDYCVFDAAVNSGPLRAAKWLQEAVGVKQDGHIGLVTITTALEEPAGGVIDRMCDLRLAYLKGLRTWKTFGRGWTARVRSVRRLARGMAQ